MYRLYSSQSVTPQPNNTTNRRIIEFTALYFANNLTVNWAEAYSIRHSCFDENRTTSTFPPGTTCISLLSCFRPFHPKIQNHGYIATELTLSSLPPRYIELATHSLMLSSKRETETEIVFYFCGDKIKDRNIFPVQLLVTT